MPAVRGRMGRHSRAVAGDGEVLRIQEAKAQGREYGKERKNLLESSLRVRGSRPAIHDSIHDVPCGGRTGIFGLHELAVRADHLFWLPAILTGREKQRPGTGISCAHPEAVHEVIVGAEGRQFFYRGTANEDSQGNGAGEHVPDP